MLDIPYEKTKTFLQVRPCKMVFEQADKDEEDDYTRTYYCIPTNTYCTPEMDVKVRDIRGKQQVISVSAIVDSLNRNIDTENWIGTQTGKRIEWKTNETGRESGTLESVDKAERTMKVKTPEGRVLTVFIDQVVKPIEDVKEIRAYIEKGKGTYVWVDKAHIKAQITAQKPPARESSLHSAVDKLSSSRVTGPGGLFKVRGTDCIMGYIDKHDKGYNGEVAIECLNVLADGKAIGHTLKTTRRLLGANRLRLKIDISKILKLEKAHDAGRFGRRIQHIWKPTRYAEDMRGGGKRNSSIKHKKSTKFNTTKNTQNTTFHPTHKPTRKSTITPHSTRKHTHLSTAPTKHTRNALGQGRTRRTYRAV